MSPAAPPPAAGPDYLERVARVPFQLGRPEDLPTTLDGLAAAGTGRAGEVRRRLARRAGHRGLADLLAEALVTRTAVGTVSGEPVRGDPGESAANRDNDLAFGIVRTRGPAVELLVDAALGSLIGVLEVAVSRGSGLDQRSWQRLVGGFDVLLSWLADPCRPPAQAVVPSAGEPGAALPEDALRRWVRGHHVFMVFAQGCALATDCLRDAWRRRDLPGAEAAAAAAGGLMRGSQGALRYAGDANQQQYHAEIRPTLMPPVAPPKMSGLHWRDHEALVRALDQSSDAWTWLGERRPDLLVGFRAALDQTYASHQGVCQHFVGDQSPSLLAAKGSARSAVGVLAQFRRLRLRALPEPELPDAGHHPTGEEGP